ncbi:MAG: ribose-5-phosphate isomerase RpiA [Candidatus Velthaea sp.]|jgi:ribose 5-phosphate isomerase A
MQTTAELKRAAGEAAVDRYVRDGMCVGLGTGSTAYYAILRVGEMVAAGASIVAVASSLGTEELCRQAGIPLVDLLLRPIAVAIDGADEVAPDFALTKGGGGALFREKCIALAAERFIVIVDESKLVTKLGAFPTPVEVLPFALSWVEREIASAFPHAAIRRRGASPSFVTDNGNAILDCAFGLIDDPAELEAELRAIHGVVDAGLFTNLTDVVLVAQPGGVRDLRRGEQPAGL